MLLSLLVWGTHLLLGKTKLEPLTKFLKSVIDGTAELKIDEEPKEDTAEPKKEEVVFENTAEQVVFTASESESAPAQHPTDEL